MNKQEIEDKRYYRSFFRKETGKIERWERWNEEETQVDENNNKIYVRFSNGVDNIEHWIKYDEDGNRILIDSRRENE